jgi:hypothetical protein
MPLRISGIGNSLIDQRYWEDFMRWYKVLMLTPALPLLASAAPAQGADREEQRRARWF